MTEHKRGRKSVEPSPVRYDRICQLMKREKIEYQSELAEILQMPQQSLSRIMKSKKISESIIRDIVNRFPEYREEWLLGYDEIPTQRELHDIENRSISLNAPVTVLYDALSEVCAREKIPEPYFNTDTIPELILMEAQLKDYAVSLMWNYVKYRKESSFWSYLDQIEEKRRCKNG